MIEIEPPQPHATPADEAGSSALVEPDWEALAREVEPDLDEHRDTPDRQELVETLLWFMHEHQCCGVQDLYEVMMHEAAKKGWEQPGHE